ncbi:LytTR family transcriptional regulator DNA-binding domain-containing protein [Geomicrobium sp. JCM 19039]|uniref:LytTR family transcriptional regulator DNA-binding domain-containing protein n=1 Tax=Geomicrobium sp. JCM 19039 TaxID=1460636 RepID=UPI00045F337D|nr:LytTR family transcriptional regulator DNA-binding domain-containing protein [Geomicrobium sp. JCM 19039]GAK10586.1 autolysis response regulater LytR [Geomicrobium sp. JCM 19039]
MITFTNLTKVENGRSIIPSINLELPKGSATVIHCSQKQGNHLITLITKQDQPSNGSISVGDFPIGVFTQNDTLYERLSVRDNLMIFAQMYDSSIDIKAVVGDWGLSDYVNEPYKKLPHSVKRRVLIARAIIHEPKTIILEDPESGVDDETKLILRANLESWQQKGITTLVTSTFLEDALSMGAAVYRLTHRALTFLETDGEHTSSETPERSQAPPPSFKKIPARSEEKLILFDPEEIDYIESIDGTSMLHVQTETFRSTLTLQELELQLLPFGFFRTHRSYLVNLQRVREVMKWTRNSYSLILSVENTSVPLSRANVSPLYEKLGIQT